MLLGDKGYIRPEFKKDYQALGIDLQTLLRRNMVDDRPKKFVKLIMQVRRRIEIVIGLLERYFAIESCGCRGDVTFNEPLGYMLLAFTVGSSVHDNFHKTLLSRGLKKSDNILTNSSSHVSK